MKRKEIMSSNKCFESKCTLFTFGIESEVEGVRVDSRVSQNELTVFYQMLITAIFCNKYIIKEN